MSESALLEPPPTAAPARPTLADLILLRLLPGKTSVAPKALRTDVAGFFRQPPTLDAVAKELTALRADEFITPKGQRATDKGRARALQYLGIEKLPERANWSTVKTKYLVPRALGLPPDVKQGNGKLAAFLLKRELDLPVGTGDTLTTVFEAIACQVLGFPDRTTLKELIPFLLAKKVGSTTPVGKKAAEKVVPHVLLKANHKGIRGLRAVALNGWADGERSTRQKEVELHPLDAGRSVPRTGEQSTRQKEAESDETFDLTDFANTVKSAARTCPTGRFGDNKVFISHVWNELRDEPQFARLGLDGFKANLVEANRADLLTLSRADLVQLTASADVRESETTHLTATFHFILIEGN